MQNSNARTVRGLSIAVVVIAGLGVLASIIGLIAMAVGHAAISDPDIIAEITFALNADPDLYYEMGAYYFDEASVAALASLTIVVCVAILAWELICSAVTLAAGVLGLRNASTPEKLGVTFGWTIAGAVAAFLSGSLIAMVLLIISAVCINRMRKPVASYQPYEQPYAAPYGQPAPASPYYAQPQGIPTAPAQPYAQPANPYVQPIAGTQPNNTPCAANDAAQGVAPNADKNPDAALSGAQSERQD